MAELIQVPFHNGVIDTVRDGRGVWVILKRACEQLGIDQDSQRRKLRGKAWACTAMMTVQVDGQGREMFALHLDSLPMWLATIEAGRVRADLRPLLNAYQKEAAKVLANHFFGRSQAAEAKALSPTEMLIAQAQTLLAQAVRLDEHEKAIAQLKDDVAVTSGQVAEIVQVQRRAEAERAALPVPAVPAAPKGPRAAINEIVRNYVLRNVPSPTGEDWKAPWPKLYREFRDRYRCDLVQRAVNAGKGVKPLDIAANLGVLPELHAVAYDLYVLGAAATSGGAS